MEFYCCSPSETFVVLTADQFVGRDAGLDFSLKSEEMCEFFDKRGYPASVVEAG